MKRIVDCLIRSVPLSIVLIGIGYLIAYVVLRNPKMLDFSLFVLGGIPIVLFLPSVFSQAKSGALHTPKVIFRKVDTLRADQKKEAEKVIPALSYVLAGLLTWLFSSVIY